MRRLLMSSTVLLGLMCTGAHAYEGISLRWSNCLGDGGTLNRSFACNTNAGTHTLVGSVELGTPLASVTGHEIRIELQTMSPTLPAWWEFKNSGTCRMTSLSMNLILPVTAVNCLDWANGQAIGGIAAYDIGFITPNRARLIAALAVPQTAMADLAAGQEYFSFSLVINNAKTVGLGACAGCLVPANLYFVSMKLTTPLGANDRTLTNPANGSDSNFALWQGGFPTATHRGTWGELKSLYR